MNLTKLKQSNGIKIQTLSLDLIAGGGGGLQRGGGVVLSSTMSSSVTGDSLSLSLDTDNVVFFAISEACRGWACGKKQKKVINSALGLLLM